MSPGRTWLPSPAQHLSPPGRTGYLRRRLGIPGRRAVTTIEPPLRQRTTPTASLRGLVRRATRWGPALLSFAAALGCGLYLALRTYEVDLGVYLRLGGRYIFTPHLYSLGLGHTGLLFTYPPFAALLFAPWQRLFTTVDAVQLGWTMCNLAASSRCSCSRSGSSGPNGG